MTERMKKMKKRHASIRFLALFTAAFLLLQTGFSAVASAPARQASLIDVTGMEIQDENIVRIVRPASVLFDEQDRVPKEPGGSVPVSAFSKLNTWQPGYNEEFGGAAFYIDLGAYYVIESIGALDRNASPTWTIQSGKPFHWNTEAVFTMDYYNAWRNIPLRSHEPTRYLHFQSSGIDSGVIELALYGYKTGELTQADLDQEAPDAAEIPSDHLTAGQFVGANAFIDDPMDALKGLGNVREYHNLSFTTDDSFRNYYSKSVNGYWNFDDYYAKLKAGNVSTVPCLQLNLNGMTSRPGGYADRNDKPVDVDEDTLDPASYSEHANILYNYAARYGANANIDLSTLSLAPNETPLTGLNLLTTAENWNEQDKTWNGGAAYFSPYEFAAMCSADYDGHEGTIPNAGVKTADPKFKLAMGGLCGAERVPEYLSLMKQWFDYNRADGKFAVDVINYHNYITDAYAPERSSFRQNLLNILNWVDENAPGREVWLSEFDVKADDKEIEGVDNHDNAAYAKARAERLLRAYLVGMGTRTAKGTGLTSMSMFMLRDEWSGVYYNSGLTTGKGEWKKKDSWYYVSAMTKALANADFDCVVEESGSVYVYRFTVRDSGDVIYAVWSPTADGSAIPDYALNVGAANHVSMITPTYGVAEGEKTALTLTDGAVTLPVTETPVFVCVSGAPERYPVKKIPVTSIQLGDLNGSVETKTYDSTERFLFGADAQPQDKLLREFSELFDEQSLAPETTDQRLEAAFTTQMDSFWGWTAAYPYDAVVTLDDKYDIEAVGLYDSYGTGKFEIYDDLTGTLLCASALDQFQSWRVYPAANKVSTNRIRVVVYNQATVMEVALYGTPSNSRVGADVPKQPGTPREPSSDFIPEKLALSSVRLGSLGGFDQTPGPANAVTFQGGVMRKSGVYALDALCKLFDEQNKAPQYANLSGNEMGCASYLDSLYGKWEAYPYDLVVTLEGRPRIDRIAVFDHWSTASGIIEFYNNETGELLASYDLANASNRFVYLAIEPVVTSSVRVVKYNTASAGEVVFYGGAST